VREEISGGDVVGCVVVEVSFRDVGVICRVCLAVLTGSCEEGGIALIIPVVG